MLGPLSVAFYKCDIKIQTSLLLFSVIQHSYRPFLSHTLPYFHLLDLRHIKAFTEQLHFDIHVCKRIKIGFYGIMAVI